MYSATQISSLAKGKPVAIFGTGVSGRAVKKLLDKLGIESNFYAENEGLIFNEHNAQQHKLVVYSPAFRPDNEWILLAEKSGTECICETDLSALAWRGKIIAITGTNGKTTLTSFICAALKKSEIDAIVAGNIGTPLSEICAENNFSENAVAVVELSSFQTSKIKYLRPDALIWTNFDADHLDWHKDLQEYFNAKINLVKNLKTNVFIAGSSVAEYAKTFSIALPDFTKFFDESLRYNAPEPFSSSIQALNFEAAKMFWECEGLNIDILEQTCKSFELPQYRFSEPYVVDNVKFYNDSKATNAHAAIAAIKELSGCRNLVWLGGGKNKNCNLSALVDAISKHCKSAVLIGQTAEILSAELDKAGVKNLKANDMQEAVKLCWNLAKEDGSVLFSPAFSSFGMFAGYAERGKSFKNAVLCLKN